MLLKFSYKVQKTGLKQLSISVPELLVHTHWQWEQIVFWYRILLLITTFSNGRLESTRGSWEEQVKTFHRFPSAQLGALHRKFSGAHLLCETKVAWKWDGKSHRVDTITVLRIHTREHRMRDKRDILKEISADTSLRLSVQWSHRASYRVWEAFCHLYHSKWERETGKGMTPSSLWWIKTKLISRDAQITNEALFNSAAWLPQLRSTSYTGTFKLTRARLGITGELCIHQEENLGGRGWLINAKWLDNYCSKGL